MLQHSISWQGSYPAAGQFTGVSISFHHGSSTLSSPRPQYSSTTQVSTSACAWAAVSSPLPYLASSCMPIWTCSQCLQAPATVA